MSEPKEGHGLAPREWVGERCFIICGGESVRKQKAQIARIEGRIIAIKHAVLLRPDADVMFVAGKDDPVVCRDLYPKFKGKYIIGRGLWGGMPPYLALSRPKTHDVLSHDPRLVAGLDAGTSACNLAYLMGATEIVLLGYDMTGGRWFNGEIPHHLPHPPQAHFDRHLANARALAPQFEAAGVKIWNASPNSRATFFEKRRLEDFL